LAVSPAFWLSPLREVTEWLNGLLFVLICQVEFQHFQISDVGMASFYLPLKPELPPTGNKCVCPNCGHESIYLRNDLLYRA